MVCSPRFPPGYPDMELLLPSICCSVGHITSPHAASDHAGLTPPWASHPSCPLQTLWEWGSVRFPHHQGSQNPSQMPRHTSGWFNRHWASCKHNPLERVWMLYPWECLHGKNTSQCRTSNPEPNPLWVCNKCPEHPTAEASRCPALPLRGYR